jgi:hypothetical protein
MGTLRHQVKVPRDYSCLRNPHTVLGRAETRHETDRRAAVTAAAADMDQVGVYLTNGVFLYRVVDIVVTESGQMADIEDCYGLDIVRMPMRAVLAGRLRLVKPA